MGTIFVLDFENPSFALYYGVLTEVYPVQNKPTDFPKANFLRKYPLRL